MSQSAADQTPSQPTGSSESIDPESAKLHSESASREDRGRDRRGPPRKKRNMGRSEWSKTNQDRRKRNDDQQDAKRRRTERGDALPPIYATEFSKDDIAAEERRPKRKVAVLIGYSGTGYRGMQVTSDQKTIEGDLFKAFVAAGAISKANADDPKKSSFVRCARTDKGVHAAGNVISLKLIVEDEDTVEKINEHLDPQIRVWGYERTNNSFSAYQLCDSRIYEYLIPTHSFLPPHSSSYLGRKIREAAGAANDEENWRSRQAEVEGFWEKVDEEMIKPILEAHDPETRKKLQEALYLRTDERGADAMVADVVADETESKKAASQATEGNEAPGTHSVPEELREKVVQFLSQVGEADVDHDQIQKMLEQFDSETRDLIKVVLLLRAHKPSASAASLTSEAYGTLRQKDKKSSPSVQCMKELRSAYITAKRSYRIPAARLERIQKCLDLYVGTRNYYNFTIDKAVDDPSARRVIKSFAVNPTPILINGTEWLSLKVHGQSFMMHQIRKMVGMVALVVRCGCDPLRIQEAYGDHGISIPKAPSLGLLLERPVFDTYNKRAKCDYGREALHFGKYEKEMEEFKQREIYERIYRDEEAKNMFGNFFNHLDNFASEAFLFVTSAGISASKSTGKGTRQKDSWIDSALESEPEEEVVRHGDGEEG